MLEMTDQTNPTAISVEAQARLAKLLATENITVEHRNVSTAMFDIKGRILILPNWKDITKDIYDLLVLHEVGHALFTPLEGWHGAVSDKGPNYKGFLNITEDARIEKKQKRKFPGGRRSFINGYKELLARDFFGIKDRDIASFGLIDRLNIHFKAGMGANVPFSDNEKVWVDRMAALETFEEAISLADDLFEEMKDDMPETDMGQGPDVNGTFSDDVDDDAEEGPGVLVPGDDESEEGDTEPFGDDDADGESDTDGDAPSGKGKGTDDADDADDTDDDDDSDADGENGEANEADKADGEAAGEKGNTDSDADEGDSPSGDQAGRDGNTSADEPRSETDEAFRNKEVTLVDDNDRSVPTYVQIPRDEAFDLDSIIIPNKEVVRALKESAVKFASDALLNVARQVKAYRNSNAKVVNYLAKEFEMRKAADASKRTSVAKTGILDTNTLHSYKWNDDIFKKVATVTDGKSHGLQMFVDWSGSMTSNMAGTIDQVLNLVLFCKKVGIPFDVYAFTDGYDRVYYNEEASKRSDRMFKSKLEKGDLEFRKANFNLLQIATSQGNRAAFNDMLTGLIILRGFFNHGDRYGNIPDSDVSYYQISRRYMLCGTPLNEAILSSIPIINRFREANGLQIVNSVFLTDGAGCNIIQAHGIARWGHYNSGKIIVRDRESRKEFVQDGHPDAISGRQMSQMSILLEMVRIRTGAKVVNFYVTSDSPNNFKREWMNSVPRKEDEFGHMQGDEKGAREAYNVAKAEGGVILEDSMHGWDHHYLILGGDTLGVHGDEGLDDALIGAKKGTLKKAFGKAASGKLRNRVVLRKFTELIAI